MICPNCGTKLPEDKLYCEKCGAEFQIVPDYDVEVQGEIDDALRHINDDYEDMEFDDDPNLLSVLIGGRRKGALAYILLALVLIIVVVAIVVMGKKISAQNSVAYQLEQAAEEAAKNNYTGAISYLEKAYKIDGKADHLFKAADYYYTLGRSSDAIYTLMEVATNDKNNEKDIISAYRKIITLYENGSDYVKLAEVIGNSGNETIMKEYSKYMSEPPVFNYESGTYKEEVTLKITTDLVGGTIYYTTDNTTPTENSSVFSTPIFLEYGNYTVNAIYVNAYGVASSVVSNKYLIDVEFEFEPTILTESGTYEVPTKIEADVPVSYTLYYTIDGADPTKESDRFDSRGIQMPLGHHVFKFVSYAYDGTRSSVVTREYDLNIPDSVAPQDAVISLMYRLVERGILIDTNGNKEGFEGVYKYMFTTAYTIQDRGDFYFVVEYSEDPSGKIVRTGDMYAVDVHNSEIIYRVSVIGVDVYQLSDF